MDIVKEICDMSHRKRRPLTERGLKLGEEVGEVQAAILSYTQSPGCEYKELTKEDIIEECVDTIIVAYSIISDLGLDQDELDKKFLSKLQKWNEKQIDSSPN